MDSGATGTTIVRGSIDVSQPAAGESAGTVHILGSQVGLFDNAQIDATATVGAGTILIGGDYQGKNAAIRNALKTYVGANVVIRADAGESGNGGKVVIWADELTQFYGTITARGGVASGDGGFAEVSGKNLLRYHGFTDLNADHGARGTLLLDPKNITIENGGADVVADNNEFNEDPADDKSFDADLIVTALAGANVELQANNDIVVNEAIDATNNNDPGNLTLRAGRSVVINENIAIEGTLTVTANDPSAIAADRDPGAGQIVIGNGATDVTLDTSDQNGNVVLNGAVVVDRDTTITTGGGPITLANATVSATAVGLDLTLNTSTTAAAANGGAVSLGTFSNAGGQFVNDLTINTTPGAGGTAGIVTLNGDIRLDDSNGAAAGGTPALLTLTGVTDVRLANSVTIDTEQGNDAAGGPLDFTGVTVSATAAGSDLTLDTSTTTAGGNGGAVTLGTFSNAGGKFINDLTINTTPGAGGAAGVIGLNNNIFVDNNGADLGSVTLAGDVRLQSTTTIDTEQGNDGAGGPITLANATVSATAVGLDLTLNTSTTAAAANGGAVSLGTFSNAGGQFVNDLTINTTPGAGGTAGIVTLNGDIRLDDSNGAAAGGTPALLTLTGVTDVRLANSVTIDTEQGNDAAGGPLDFTGVTVSATAAGSDLTLDTSTTTAGGNGGAVTLGTFGNAGGKFINDLTINTTPGAGGAAGVIGLNNNIFVDNNGADLGSVTLAGDVRLQSTTTIDTEQGNDGAGGPITLANATVSATAVGLDLTLNTSTTAAAANGGAVSLGTFSNAGGQFVNDLTINTTPGAGGTAGIVTLNGDIRLDDSNGAAAGGTPALLTLTGVTDVRLANSVTIDTEQGNDAAGGPLDFTGVTVSATAAGSDLTLDTSTTAAGGNGGNVLLGDVIDLDGVGAAFQRLQSLVVKTTGATAGTLTLDDGDGTATSTLIQVENNVDFSGVDTVILADNVQIDTNPNGVSVNPGDDGNVKFRGTGKILDDGAAQKRDLTITVNETIADGHVELPRTIGEMGGSAEIGVLSVTADTGRITLGAAARPPSIAPVASPTAAS